MKVAGMFFLYSRDYSSLWSEVTKIIRGSNSPDWDLVTKKKALLGMYFRV